MDLAFGEKLRQLRTERNLSQLQLAEQMFVTRSTVARWENGSRMPDATVIARLCHLFGVEAGALLVVGTPDSEYPRIIMVDDERIILAGGLPILEEVFPEASVTGFTKPSEALEYAEANPVSLAFLDVEMGKISGLELCEALQRINPRTNVVFLTAYLEYSFEAWNTGACGFLLKPITADAVRKQVQRLRYPLRGMNGV